MLPAKEGIFRGLCDAQLRAFQLPVRGLAHLSYQELSLFEGEAWESEGEFEWCQFYLSRRLFDEVAGEGVLLADAWLRDATRTPAVSAQRTVPKGARRSEAVLRAMEFAEAHLDRNISLEEMASAAGVSRFHLVRLFREFVGQTPAAFARTRRVERSKDLLRGSDLPISEIALLCGFADQSHFTTVFAQSTGVTPGAFRQRI